jgi:hypothetical protein
MAVGSNATVVGTDRVAVANVVVVGGSVAAGVVLVAAANVVVVGAANVVVVGAAVVVVVGAAVVGGSVAPVEATTAEVITGTTRCDELELHAPSINAAARTAMPRAVDDQAAVVAPVGDRSRLVPCGTRDASAAGVPKAATSRG